MIYAVCPLGKIPISSFITLCVITIRRVLPATNSPFLPAEASGPYVCEAYKKDS